MTEDPNGSLPTTRRPKIGLALGAGAARGWAHIGALQALEELGFKPDVVCGCSSGAVVGASYVCGKLDDMAEFASTLTWRGMLGFFDLTWRGGGLIEGRWLVDFFQRHFEDIAIEDTPTAFAAVATELHTGREAWLTRGSIIQAVRASVSLPGLLTPIKVGERWMVDGALVNPLPVSLCRALGAEVIIGVSPSGGVVNYTPASAQPPPSPAEPPPPPIVAPAPDEKAARQGKSSWLAWLAAGLARGSKHTPPPTLRDAAVGIGARPGYVDVIGNTFFIVQSFVARVRLAADPVDLLISPEVGHIGVMDFHRGADAISAGRKAVEDNADRIRALCGIDAQG